VGENNDKKINTKDNVYSVVISAELLREFTRFIWCL